MPTSVSTITTPVQLLIQFIYLPKLVYFCAVFSYEGFRNNVTLTHHGMRKGFVAKLYAVFYLVGAVLFLIEIPTLGKALLAIKPADFIAALTFAIPSSEVGFFLIAFALFLVLMSKGMLKYGKKKPLSRRSKIHRTRNARKFTYWIAVLPFAIGIQFLLGLPEWVTVCISTFYIYFAPITSPSALKKILPIPVEEEHSRHNLQSSENLDN